MVNRDLTKTITVIKEVVGFNQDFFTNILRDLANGSLNRKGEVSYKSLIDNTSKQKAVIVNEDYINAFRNIAKKYDIKFSIQQRKNKDGKEQYYMFFQYDNANSQEKFKNCFFEYLQYQDKMEKKKEQKISDKEKTPIKEVIKETKNKLNFHNHRDDKSKEREREKTNKKDIAL